MLEAWSTSSLRRSPAARNAAASPRPLRAHKSARPLRPQSCSTHTLDYCARGRSLLPDLSPAVIHTLPPTPQRLITPPSLPFAKHRAGGGRTTTDTETPQWLSGAPAGNSAARPGRSPACLCARVEPWLCAAVAPAWRARCCKASIDGSLQEEEVQQSRPSPPPRALPRAAC